MQEKRSIIAETKEVQTKSVVSQRQLDATNMPGLGTRNLRLDGLLIGARVHIAALGPITRLKFWWIENDIVGLYCVKSLECVGCPR
jgi:hypothetical protein